MTTPLPAIPDERYFEERILPFDEGPKGADPARRERLLAIARG